MRTPPDTLISELPSPIRGTTASPQPQFRSNILVIHKGEGSSWSSPESQLVALMLVAEACVERD
jgi:hypothetical protein